MQHNHEMKKTLNYCRHWFISSHALSYLVDRTARCVRKRKEGKGSLLYSACYELLISKRSGMARVNEGSHRFTCHPHVYPQEGASTSYKRWSKCTTEKVGGRFLQELKGKVHKFHLQN